VLSAIIAVLLCVGCGSSSKAPSAGTTPTSSAPTSAPPTPTTAAPTGPALSAAVAQITRNWKLFFAGSTPAKQKEALLQGGGLFASVIAAQANSPMARQTTALVSQVTVTSASIATVSYSIALNGKVALPNQVGAAVRAGNVWRVSQVSFCQLLRLEGTVPAACKVAPSPVITQ
jgi:hypothetical protein